MCSAALARRVPNSIANSAVRHFPDGAALDAACLSKSLYESENNIERALARYDRLRGEFGRSLKTQRPVLDEVGPRLWNTALLAVLSTLFATAFGLLVAKVAEDLDRLVARFGWEDLVFTHITARVPGTPDQFLINPYGVFFDEITASSLVKIDVEGAEPTDDHRAHVAGRLHVGGRHRLDLRRESVPGIRRQSVPA